MSDRIKVTAAGLMVLKAMSPASYITVAQLPALHLHLRSEARTKNPEMMDMPFGTLRALLDVVIAECRIARVCECAKRALGKIY